MKKNAPTLSPEQIKKAREAVNALVAKTNLNSVFERARLKASSWKPVSTEDPYRTEQHIDLFNVIRELDSIADKLRSGASAKGGSKIEALEDICYALLSKCERLEFKVEALQRAIAGKPVKYTPRKRAKLQIETGEPENQ